MKFISKIILLSVCLFFLGFFANAQNNKLCDVNPFEIVPQGKGYFGGCINGKAEGLGILTDNSGNTIRGIFKNNVLQDGIVEFTFFQKKAIYVGPYVNGKLNGCFTVYDLDMSVYTNNMIPGGFNEFSGDWNYFNIPEPKLISDNIFPLYQEKKDIKYPILEIINPFEKPNEIPNTSLKLFRLNNKGFALYDAKTNLVIREYGSYTNRLDKFLTFSPDFKSFFATKMIAKVIKVVKVEISSGVISAIPTELEKSYLEKSAFLTPGSYKDQFGFDNTNPLPISTSKFILKARNEWIKDGDFYNSEFTVNTLNGVLLQRLKLNHKAIKNFAFNENLQQVAISAISKDSIFINLYSLDSLKFIQQIHAYEPKYSYNYANQIGFTPSGKYLYFGNNDGGTLIFKNGRPYYGVKGLFDFNNEENTNKLEIELK